MGEEYSIAIGIESYSKVRDTENHEFVGSPEVIADKLEKLIKEMLNSHKFGSRGTLIISPHMRRDFDSPRPIDDPDPWIHWYAGIVINDPLVFDARSFESEVCAALHRKSYCEVESVAVVKERLKKYEEESWPRIIEEWERRKTAKKEEESRSPTENDS